MTVSVIENIDVSWLGASNLNTGYTFYL